MEITKGFDFKTHINIVYDLKLELRASKEY